MTSQNSYRGATNKNSSKVCIVGLKCYDLLVGAKVPRFIGGIETQLVLLAKGLAEEGCDVSFITYDHGQTDDQIIEGIRVLKAYRPDGGIRGLRWLSRAKQLWRAMESANSDIYLQMGAGIETGLVALGVRKGQGCRSHFVYCLASDLDHGAMFRRGRLGWEGKSYRYGLMRADLVVAQTKQQRKALRERLSINSQVIPMAAPSPLPTTATGSGRNGSSRVVWVGRAAKEKRLEWLIEVASRCPEFQFQVVGTANNHSDYSARILREAKRLANVELVGRLGREDMHAVYSNAHILCNTSVCEGFPTTFLEAWSYGLPVVTTFDSDGIVLRNGLGRVPMTTDEMANALRELHRDDHAYTQISEAAKRYYLQNHAIPVVARRFRHAFEEILAALGKAQPRNG